MELRYALLADYAAEDKVGKPIIVGVFDLVHADPTVRPIVLPPFWLVAQFHAHVTEGTEHRLEIRLNDADGKDVIPRVPLTLKFVPQGPGRPLIARLLAQAGPGLQIPQLGEYSLNLFVDGRREGGVPLHVVARQPTITG
jgi:hypothetical protein